jgi:hypothetical protein
MAESSERQASWPITPLRDQSDISEELFGAYKKEYIQERRVIEEETKWNLEWLKKMFWLSKSKPPEKPKEPIYDPLKLSRMGKKFLDANHEKLKIENPDTTTILVYQQGTDDKKSEARHLSIPRSNPENKPLRVNGFVLTPSPKSNGYNTEYIITGPDGKEWTQLAVFFPATNPKYKRKRDAEKLLRETQAELPALQEKYRKEKNAKKKQAILSDISKLQGKIQSLPNLIASYGEPEQYTHFSYIPYREAFDTPENQKAWFQYLKASMIATYQYRNPLNGKPVTSIHNIDTKLTVEEELPWQFPFILNLVERMDFEEYFARPSRKILQSNEVTDPLMKKQLGRALTTFGVNTKDAFNWQGKYQRCTVSRSNAQEYLQSLPKTCSVWSIFSRRRLWYCFFWSPNQFSTSDCSLRWSDLPISESNTVRVEKIDPWSSPPGTAPRDPRSRV